MQDKWVKSSRSGNNGNCTEWQIREDGVLVRDSKNPDGAVLRFTHAEWLAFIAGVKLGEADL